MRALVTGATGLIGFGITQELLRRGHAVTALVRDEDKARRILPSTVTLVRGDVVEAASLSPAMQNIDWVFHAAGVPEQWLRDDTLFDEVNRGGTKNVLQAAKDAGVKRVIYTSTMDVFAAPRGGELVETHIDAKPKPTAYERSKQAAEKEAEAFLAQGLDIVFLNPSAVYGPSPVHVSVNTFIIDVLNRKVPFLPPGGMSVVYVDGCSRAHVDAAERAKTGERFLLADRHFTMRELAQATLIAAGKQRAPSVAPGWILKIVAHGSAPLARAFKFKPLIAPGQLSFVLWNARVNNEKAQRELGFHPTPFAEGIAYTIASLREQKLIR